MSKTVFISYSTKDAEGAQEICRLLEARGVSCWIAPRDVPPGADWAESIMNGIKEAQGFVLVLSEHVNTSRHCKSEVEVAFSAGKAVFPVRLRQIEPSQSLHLFLSSSQWIDAFDPPLDAHMDRLAAAIKTLTGEALTADEAAAVATPAPKRTAPVSATAATVPDARPTFFQRIANPKNRRYAIAAVVVLAVLLGWSMLGGGGGSSDEGANDGVPSAGSSGSPSSARRTGAEPQPGEERQFDGIDFVWIPAGTFSMGSPRTETGRGRDEDPIEVTISKGFWMGKYEVTKEQWATVMETKPWQGKDRAPNPPDSPVVYVSWPDVQLFLSKLNNAEPGPYRLPTEAEWEYAARAGTTGTYSFGEHEGWRLAEYGVSREMTDKSGEKHAHSVGTLKPNAWGLYDIHGNVWEWCNDWYGPYPYADDGPFTDPQGPETGRYGRVVRGGSWGDWARECRSAKRHRFTESRGYGTIGFRLVRNAD